MITKLLPKLVILQSAQAGGFHARRIFGPAEELMLTVTITWQ